MFRSSKELNFYTGILGGMLGDDDSDSEDDFQPSVNFPDVIDLGRIRIEYDVEYEGNRIHASKVLYMRYLSKKKQFLFFENIRNVTELKEELSPKQKRESGYHTLMNLIDLSKTKSGSYQCNDEHFRIEFNGVFFQQFAEEGIIGFVEKEKYGIVLSQLSLENYLQIIFVLRKGVSKRKMKDLTRLYTKPFFFKNRICFWDTTSILEMSKLIFFDKFCTPKNNLFEISKNDILQSRMEGIDLCYDLILLPEKYKISSPGEEEMANRRRDLIMKFGLHRCTDDKKLQIFRNEVEEGIGISRGYFNGLEKILLCKFSSRIDKLEVSDLFCGIDTTCEEFQRYTNREVMVRELTNLILYGTRGKPSSSSSSSNEDRNKFRNQIFLSIEKNDPKIISERIKNLKILKNMRLLDLKNEEDEYDDFSFSLIIGKNLRIRWTELSIVSYSEINNNAKEDKAQFLIPLSPSGKEEEEEEDNNNNNIFQNQKFEVMVDKIVDTMLFWNSQHYFKRRFSSSDETNNNNNNNDPEEVRRRRRIRVDLNKDEEGTQFIFFKELLNCVFKERRKFNLIKELENYIMFLSNNDINIDNNKKSLTLFNQFIISKEKSKELYHKMKTFSDSNDSVSDGDDLEEEGEDDLEEEEDGDSFISFDIEAYESLEKFRFQLFTIKKKSDFEKTHPFYHRLILGRRNAMYLNANKSEIYEGDGKPSQLEEFEQYMKKFIGDEDNNNNNNIHISQNSSNSNILIDEETRSIISNLFKKRRICEIYQSSIKFLDMNLTPPKKSSIDQYNSHKLYNSLQKKKKNQKIKKKEEEEEGLNVKKRFPMDVFLVILRYVDEPRTIYQLMFVSKSLRFMIEKDVANCCENVTFALKISHEKLIERHLTSPTDAVVISLPSLTDLKKNQQHQEKQEKQQQKKKKKKRAKRKVWKYVHRVHIGNSSKFGGVTFNRGKDLQIYLLSDLFPNIQHVRISENNLLRNSNLNHLQCLKSLELFWCQGIDNPKSFRCLSKTLTSFSFCEHSLLKYKSELDDDSSSSSAIDPKVFGVNDSIFLYLDQLEHLKLARYHERFGPFGFKHLKQLKTIELNDSHLGDEIFMMNLSKLESIVLRNCHRMTDHLFSSKMKSLKKVVVESCENFKENGFLKIPCSPKIIQIRGCKVMSIIKMENVIERLEKKRKIGAGKIKFSMKY